MTLRTVGCMSKEIEAVAVLVCIWSLEILLLKFNRFRATFWKLSQKWPILPKNLPPFLSVQTWFVMSWAMLIMRSPSVHDTIRVSSPVPSGVERTKVGSILTAAVGFVSRPSPLSISLLKRLDTSIRFSWDSRMWYRYWSTWRNYLVNIKQGFDRAVKRKNNRQVCCFRSLPLSPLACSVGDTSFPAQSSTWLHRYYLNWTKLDNAITKFNNEMHSADNWVLNPVILHYWQNLPILILCSALLQFVLLKALYK